MKTSPLIVSFMAFSLLFIFPSTSTWANDKTDFKVRKILDVGAAPPSDYLFT